MTYNKSDDAIQAIYRPLTQNTNETALIFTHTCPFTTHAQCPISLPINIKFMLNIEKYSIRSQTNAIIDL